MNAHFQPPHRYRAIFISDIHLGTRRAQTESLLGFLKLTESDWLYVVGDLIDNWALRKVWHWDQLHNDVIQKLLRKARKGTKVVYIPGNHDEPEAMRRELKGAPFQICGTHEADGWQFVMLDSYDPGHVGGRLTEAELARLDSALTQSPKHAMVCLHHHPVPMSSRWLDRVGLTNATEFLHAIDAHRNVRAIVWGHVHQSYDGLRKGVRLLATPSTCAQFLPNSDDLAVDPRSPAYRRFELRADGSLLTEVVWVEQHCGGSSHSACSAA